LADTGKFSLGQLNATTSKVNLANKTLSGAIGIVGTQFVWQHLSLAVEANFGMINMYSLKASATF